jgi:rubrerythrin
MTLFVVFACRQCGYEALWPWASCPVCGAADDQIIEHWGDVRRERPTC